MELGQIDSAVPRKRVLVFDPDPDVLVVLERVLRHIDANLELASDGSEARQLCLNRPPDVMLVDLWRGHSADLELARMLERTRPGARVVLLAREQIEQVDVADTVISVPFSPARLFEMISTLVQARGL